MSFCCSTSDSDSALYLCESAREIFGAGFSTVDINRLFGGDADAFLSFLLNRNIRQMFDKEKLRN